MYRSYTAYPAYIVTFLCKTFLRAGKATRSSWTSFKRLYLLITKETVVGKTTRIRSSLNRVNTQVIRSYIASEQRIVTRD